MTERTKLEGLLTAAGVGYTVLYDGPGEDCPLDGDDPVPPAAVPPPDPPRARRGPLPAARAGDPPSGGPPRTSPR